MNRRRAVACLSALAAAAAWPPRSPAARVPAEGARTSRPPQPTPRSRFVRSGSVRLHVLEWGDVGARPLVLLHAGMLNAHAWDDFGRAMAPHFHVVAPDARGFGDSDWGPPASYVGDVFADDLHAIVCALGLGRFVLCGNSLGGTTALWYANLHPELVDRLILVDTGPGPRPADPPAASAPPPAAPATAAPPRGRPPGPPLPPPGPFASPDDATARVEATLGPAFAAAGAPWPGLARAVVHENLRQDARGAWRWKFDREGIAGGFERGQADPRRWPFWRSIACPTLVLRGARSPALPQEAAEEMVRENANARLVVVAEAGHFIALERPAAFEQAVREWLRV